MSIAPRLAPLHKLLSPTFDHEFFPEHLEANLPFHSFHPMMYHPFYHRHLSKHRHHPYDRSLGTRKSHTKGVSTIHMHKDKFLVTLDVQQFQSEDLNVKVVGNYVIVEGKDNDFKTDNHGLIQRSFTRKYLVPEQCDISKLASKLSSDGVLIISAPRKDLSVEDKNERVVPIEQTKTDKNASIEEGEPNQTEPKDLDDTVKAA